MASQWYCRLATEEFGPVTFDELVELVVEGRVGWSTPVRREWPADWQRAETVAGLFREARRRNSLAATPSPADEAAAAADIQPNPRNAPAGWLRRFARFFARPQVERPVGTGPPAHAPPARIPVPIGSTGDASNAAEVGCVGVPTFPATDSFAAEDTPTGAPPPLPATPVGWGGPDWAEVVAAAMRSAEARDRALDRDRRPRRAALLPVAPLLLRIVETIRRVVEVPVTRFRGPADGRSLRRRDRVAGWLAALERRLPRPGVLRPTFRFGTAAVSANLAAFGLLKWSDRQALRFPGRDGALQLQVFPLVGECGDTEYLILLAHATLFAGAAAYLAARWLDAHADD